MIDIHTHLLPGVDDGPSTVECPQQVLGQFAADGITDVVLTPHVRSSELASNAPDVLEQRRVDGIILAASSHGSLAPLHSVCQAHGVWLRRMQVGFNLVN